MESINMKTMQPSSLVLKGASDQSAPPRDVQTKKSVAADIVSASNIRSDRIEEVSNSLALQRTESGEKIEKLQEALADVVARLNESMKSNSKELNFSVDEVSKRIMVSVTDRRTGEVIRQVPSEAILKVAHNIEALKGVIFDKNI